MEQSKHKAEMGGSKRTREGKRILMHIRVVLCCRLGPGGDGTAVAAAVVALAGIGNKRVRGGNKRARGELRSVFNSQRAGGLMGGL